MLRGMYTAATGMLVQRKKMDVITNNIANLETTGFKASQLISRSFKDLLIARINDPSIVGVSQIIGSQNNGIQVDQIFTDFTQGALEQTDRSGDLAIAGEGYFAISTPKGERYTRDGTFYVNSEGYLTTADGNYVQGTNGRIHVGASDFQVDEQGNITVKNVSVGKLKIVTFDDSAGLRSEGGNLYYNYNAKVVTPTTPSTVKQGYLEASNVDITKEMVDMISVSRTYETNQKILKMLDESLGKAVNEVGRI